MVLPKRRSSYPPPGAVAPGAAPVDVADPASPGDARLRRIVDKRAGTRIVTVTGAASFLGANLVGLLEEDETVARIVAIDIAQPSTAHRKTRFYEVDFTQPTAEARLSEIFAAERTDT